MNEKISDNVRTILYVTRTRWSMRSTYLRNRKEEGTDRVPPG